MSKIIGGLLATIVGVGVVIAASTEPMGGMTTFVTTAGGILIGGGVIGVFFDLLQSR